jgi:oligo-alginate lyase
MKRLVVLGIVVLLMSGLGVSQKKGGSKREPTQPAAGSFPKPNPEKVFPELKMYDAAGHPWRAAKEDWEGACRRVASDSAWAAWATEERATVDAWMAKHHDRVSWIAGWSNNFVSPKDGSKLIYTDAVPGEEIDHFSSHSDPRVEITPVLKAAWVRQWREKHAEMMERAARLYRLTNEKRYADWAAGQLDFYAEHFLEWEPQRQGARLFWQSLTEGVNLATYNTVVRVLGEYVAPERKKIWFEKFFKPEVEVIDAAFPRILNITCWLRGTSAQVGLVFGDETMWKRSLNSEFGVRRQVNDGITSDYLWFEQSLGYNSLVVHAFLSLFTTVGIYGRTGELAQEMATVENLLLSPSYLRFPTGQLPNPSDTKGLLFAPDRKAFAAACRVFPTAIGLTEIAGIHNWDALLDPPAAPPTNAEALPPMTSRSFESTRMAQIKKGLWQVFFQYGQMPINSHLHAEVLNYSAFYGNVDITHDPGTVGYGSPLHKFYYTKGLNHNVPLVNGEGEDNPPQRGELLEYSAEKGFLAAAQPAYRRDARARRSLSIDGEKLVDTVVVECSSADPQKLGLTLHLQGSVQLPREFAADETFTANRPKGFEYWKDVKGAAFRNSASFDVVFGNVPMRVTIAVPGDFRIWHASSPDAPPDRRECFYLETIGTRATFVTTFAPGPGAAEKAQQTPDPSSMRKKAREEAPSDEDPQK